MTQYTVTIDPDPGGATPVQFTSVPVTAAQILDLDNTSVELLPAPGGRFYYVVHAAFLHYRFVTTPYEDSDSSYLAIGYGPSPIEYYVAVMRNDGPTVNAGALLAQTEDAYASMSVEKDASGAWLASEIENRALMLGTPDSSLGAADGDSTLTVRLWYSLIDGAP